MKLIKKTIEVYDCGNIEHRHSKEEVAIRCATSERYRLAQKKRKISMCYDYLTTRTHVKDLRVKHNHRTTSAYFTACTSYLRSLSKTLEDAPEWVGMRDIVDQSDYWLSKLRIEIMRNQNERAINDEILSEELEDES